MLASYGELVESFDVELVAIRGMQRPVAVDNGEVDDFANIVLLGEDVSSSRAEKNRSIGSGQQQVACSWLDRWVVGEVGKA